MADKKFEPPGDRTWEFFEKTREATFKSLDSLLKTIILVNGGSAVAVLGLAGEAQGSLGTAIRGGRQAPSKT
jgi:hypothetical protein